MATTMGNGGQPEQTRAGTRADDVMRSPHETPQGQEPADHLAYWQRRLADAPTEIDVPTDYPRPSAPTHHRETVSAALPADLHRALQTFSQQEHTPLSIPLLAAFSTLLFRYSGQDDLVIGTSTLPLRLNLAGNPTFRALLQRARETLQGALEHQEVAFDHLVRQLRPAHPVGQNPFTQVRFGLHSSSEPLASGWFAGSSGLEQDDAQFDLELALAETPESLIGQFTYKTDLFEAPTIQRMLGHWQTLLAGIVADPDQPIATLPLLTDLERHQFLVDWNDTSREIPSDRLFSQLFEAQVERVPEALAAVCDGEQVTYQELNRRANRLARLLVKAGVGPDVLVAILAERSINFLTTVLAVFKAGGAYLPLDPRHPAKRYTQVLGQSKSALVLTTSEFLAVLSEVLADFSAEERPALSLIEELLQQEQPEENLPARSAPNDLAYVIFTSGSTGMPKGAMVEQRGMLNHLYAKVFDLHLTETDIVAETASQCFDISVWQFLSALLVGGQVHIFKDDIAFDALQLPRQVEQQKITVLETVPSLLRAMLEQGNGDGLTLAALRWLVPTGEALPPELCRQWLNRYPSIPMVNAYGPTECSDDVTHYLVSVPPAPDVVLMPIGRPIINMQMYVLGAQLQPVPIRVVGELYVGGIGVGRGYVNAPEKTAEAFQRNPFAQEPEARLYKTGDLARYLPDGNIEYLGRVDHQVKIRGFRIELGEIETALAQHPDIREVVVVAREDHPGNKRLVAYIVPVAAEAPTVTALHSFLKDRLPPYMVPAAFVVLQAMPLNSNGKLDRKALPAPDETSLSSTADFVAPRTFTEEQVAGIWAELLGLKQVGVTTNFFELGGHSLMAVQMLVQVKDHFQVEVPLASFLDTMTVEGLAAQIEALLIEKIALMDDDEVQQLLKAPEPTNGN